MKGDFTRNTFNPRKHFSRVLMQQGRVQLDADWNEQSDILLHYLRTVVADLVGPYAAPMNGGGFELQGGDNGDFGITRGRIYVDGILVENDAESASYMNQPLPPKGGLQNKGTYLAYLDVWEEHVTGLEDPDIREKALGGPDTATRAQVVWQVKTLPAVQLQGDDRSKLEQELKARQDLLNKLNDQYKNAQDPQVREALAWRIQAEQEQIDFINARLAENVDWCGLIGKWPHLSDAWLKAHVEQTEASKDPCIQKPDAKYRGATNQLYRVEIQQGGKAKEATFKWSRDNGSLATALLDVQGKQLVVENARGFVANGWVEVSNNALRLQGQPGTLIQIVNVEGDELTFDPDSYSGGVDLQKMTYVRRWDQQATGDINLTQGAILVKEGDWITLEDGIQIWFVEGGTYQAGDYWLIPARVITGSLDLPMVDGPDGPESEIMPPQGVAHYYAPLGLVTSDGNNVRVEPQPQCRCRFRPLDCIPLDT